MNKFNIMTEDQVVLSYLNCYDSIEEEEIRSCTSLFETLNENTLEIGNYAENGFIKRGVKVKAAVKKYRAINTYDISQSIRMYTDLKDLLFVKSLTTLSNVLPYLSTDDRFCLTTMFRGMSELKRGIGQSLEIDGQKIFPIYNYKESETKKTLVKKQ